MHWSEKYLFDGDAGKLNCVEFVELVLNREFMRKVQFPQTKYRGNVFAMTNEMKKYRPEFVGELTNQPEPGDLVIMSGKRLSSHVGIYIEIHGIGFVLHTFYRSKSVLRTRLKDIAHIGLQLQGVYKWLEF